MVAIERTCAFTLRRKAIGEWSQIEKKLTTASVSPPSQRWNLVSQGLVRRQKSSQLFERTVYNEMLIIRYRSVTKSLKDKEDNFKLSPKEESICTLQGWEEKGRGWNISTNSKLEEVYHGVEKKSDLQSDNQGQLQLVSLRDHDKTDDKCWENCSLDWVLHMGKSCYQG